ncbi:hypothetical protein BABINDRAFT_53755 [Babjeviella inositovora NRRL Y-12698]|uniref:Cation efflux protein cytoplasmic domain-containing protein n=1 Tax=Babjeviella inositovora NRRL Y-12698 TaxID=984486 RepID=A0A1E3QK80_9ASCO|nr:uncharacterized protein BABINDRAFT_53755 [Babjeviella inositovora NRRL Y-12698]ODQ77864.1 hypothetical protein BABINDRAFT_53755 [Babjeviella inositovora NRRL Y-12698]
MRSKSPVRQPFNFQSQMMMHNNSSANSLTGHTRTSSNTGLKPAHRKGHRYKHSSVSMNLFQEPKLRADINIPVTLPFPKLGEIRGSLSHEQSTQVAWGLWHVLLSALLYLINRHTGLPNFDTLSHLVFYDSVSIMAMIIVNVMGNFDCWNTSLIKYPFGLGRIQVLAGFALAIWLSFVGFDLSNHCVEAYMAEFVVGEGHAHDTPSGGHSHHHHHAHPDMSGYDVVNGNRFVFLFMLLLTIFTTIVSAKLIRSDSSHKSLANIVSMSDLKVTKWDRQQLWARLSQKMNNPAHLLTLVLADLLLLTYNPFYPCAINEKIMAFTIAILIIVLGIKLTHKLGLILILSFPASAKQFDRLLHEVENDIKNLDAFKSSTNLSEIFITKFNYKLYVIGLRLKMIGGSDQDECLLRNDIVRLIKRHLSDYEERAVDNDAFEITVDIDRL